MRRSLHVLALALLSGCAASSVAETERHLVRSAAPVYAGSRIVAHSDDHWTEVAACRLCGSLDYEVRSGLFGSIDDVSIVVRSDGAGGAFLHVKSASRGGGFDWGVNDARIRKFLDDLQALLAAHPG